MWEKTNWIYACDRRALWLFSPCNIKSRKKLIFYSFVKMRLISAVLIVPLWSYLSLVLLLININWLFTALCMQLLYNCHRFNIRSLILMILSVHWRCSGVSYGLMWIPYETVARGLASRSVGGACSVFHPELGSN